MMEQALIIDGQVVGFVGSAYGGMTNRAVIPVESTDLVTQRKELSGGIGHTPLVMKIGVDLERSVYEWISESWRHGIVNKNCGIVLVNSDDMRTYGQWNFSDAYISEVTIPACDGTSKEPGYLALAIVPEGVEYEPGGGTFSISTRRDRRRAWFLSNFRIEIENLPCNRVVRMESFTWKQRLVDPTVASDRFAVSAPSMVEVPDLKLTISLADIRLWAEWHQNSVIRGSGNELAGSLKFLGSDQQTEIARIGLENLGIFSIGMGSTEASTSDINYFQVELYCERMNFEKY